MIQTLPIAKELLGVETEGRCLKAQSKENVGQISVIGIGNGDTEIVLGLATDELIEKNNTVEHSGKMEYIAGNNNVTEKGNVNKENVLAEDQPREKSEIVEDSGNVEYPTGNNSVTDKEKVGTENVVSGNHHKEEKCSTLQKHLESTEDDLSVCGSWSNTTGCDPRRGPYKLTGLFLICFLEFGSYFCGDAPGALQDQIITSMEINTTLFASLNALSAWPNVVLCFIGGYLIDRVFGVHLGTIIFSMLVVVGQVMLALGAYAGHFWCMGCGMFIFGIGADILSVGVNIYIVQWFKSKELNTVFGLKLSMTRIGSTICFLITGPLYAWIDTFSDRSKTLGITLLIVGLTCVISLGCALVLGLLDKNRSRVMKLDSTETGKKIEIKDIFTFKTSFWMLSLICVTFYISKIPFIGLSKIFYMRKFDFDEAAANGVNSMVFFIAVITTPLLGAMIDRMGHNILWLFISLITCLVCHGVLAFTFLNPYIIMGIMGVAYSLLASALWPMVSLIIPEHQLGTAYGIMSSIQNLGLALMTLLAGYIVDTKGYLFAEMFYMIWLCVAIASTTVMWLVDVKDDSGYLSMSMEQREAFKETQKKSYTKEETKEIRPLLSEEKMQVATIFKEEQL